MEPRAELHRAQAARRGRNHHAVEFAALAAVRGRWRRHWLRERVVVKPSEETPATATLVAEVMDEVQAFQPGCSTWFTDSGQDLPAKFS